MELLFAPLAILIEWPWLVVVPAIALVVAYVRRRARWSLAGANAWLLYGAYEMGMKLRILCTGECNIRVDLLLIYPGLVVMTVVAAVSYVRRGRPSGTPDAP